MKRAAMTPAFTSDLLAVQFGRSLMVCSQAEARIDVATVFALLDSYAPMQFLSPAGEDGPECHEIIEHLLAPSLRAALRRFYSECNPEQMNPVARDFRSRLSLLAQEEL